MIFHPGNVTFGIPNARSGGNHGNSLLRRRSPHVRCSGTHITLNLRKMVRLPTEILCSLLANPATTPLPYSGRKPSFAVLLLRHIPHTSSWCCLHQKSGCGAKQIGLIGRRSHTYFTDPSCRWRLAVQLYNPKAFSIRKAFPIGSLLSRGSSTHSQATCYCTSTTLFGRLGRRD